MGKSIRKRQKAKKAAIGSNQAKSATKSLQSQDFPTVRYPASRYISPQHDVLVVGEGDFSFGGSVIKLRHQYAQVYGAVYNQGSLLLTGYDSREEALKKYKNTISASLQTVGQLGSQTKSSIEYAVDATKLHQQQTQTLNCNIIVFNFPHSGQQRVHVNRQLIQEFFESVKRLWSHVQTLSTRRHEVHVTIKNQPPYSLWGIPDLAREVGGFELMDTFNFDFNLFSKFGYCHQTTVGPELATTQPADSCEEISNLSQTMVFEFKGASFKSLPAKVETRNHRKSSDFSLRKILKRDKKKKKRFK